MSPQLGAIWKDIAPHGVSDSERAADVHRKRTLRASYRDVEIPAIVNPERMESCRLDLERYCREYETATFPLAFSRDQLRDISEIQDTVLTHGKTAKAGPRGDGKTSRARAAIRWALLYGHCRFVFMLCDVFGNTMRNLKIIRRSFERNKLLYDDFPWLCACARALEGAYNRGGMQTTIVNGERVRTGIQFGGGKENILVAPTIPGIPASGFMVGFGSMDGALRGINYVLDDGVTVLRPDLVFCDDPQKRESAQNQRLVDEDMTIFFGDVLGQSGPGARMAVIYRGSIIAEGDMTARMVDRKLHPDMRGRTDKLIYSPPTNAELWKQYDDLRVKSFAEHADIRLATEFYGAHRCKKACRDRLDEPRPCAECARAARCMDAGAVIAWPARHEKDEFSAVQNAQNLLSERGPEVFASEFQSEPKRADATELLILTAYTVTNATYSLPRDIVPNDTIALTLGVDVNKSGAHWVILSLAAGRRARAVDYGVQDIDAPKGLIAPGDTRKLMALDLAIRHGLAELRDRFMEKPFQRQDGKEIRPAIALVDSKWMRDAIIAFTLEESSRGWWFAAMGCGTMPGQPNWRPPKDAEISRDGNMYVRLEEIELKLAGAKPQRVTARRFFCHSDYYKKAVHDGYFLQEEDAGSLRLFTPEHYKDHHSYAHHMVAEMQVEKYPGIYVWKERKGYAANHYFDATYLALACASILEHKMPEIGIGGLALPPTDPKAAAARARAQQPHSLSVTEVEI